MSKYDEFKEEIETIRAMDLSDCFRKQFETLVHYLKNYNKFRVWEYVDALYPAVKLENITDEQIAYIKKVILEIYAECPAECD